MERFEIEVFIHIDGNEVQGVKDIALDGQFWAYIRYVL